jgi:hypothetical protein
MVGLPTTSLHRRASCRTNDGTAPEQNYKTHLTHAEREAQQTYAADFSVPNQTHLAGAFGLSAEVHQRRNSLTNRNLTHSGVPLVSRKPEMEALNLPHSGVPFVSRDCPNKQPDGSCGKRPVSRDTKHAQAQTWTGHPTPTGADEREAHIYTPVRVGSRNFDLAACNLSNERRKRGAEKTLTCKLKARPQDGEYA